ncbi:glycosyltransferase family 2 protein [Ramlibacter sp. WS9]|uniref:glycosyltransferase family 2 protein n=1 Tax=Ramlibacter sp. WS9 TaxID=1882741 RepID=UPI00114510CC|nr:glycosyltransferase family 2 protein [Ramlibacter sp. WS9]ROZ79119.1 glycosyltransferase [Ramlibacter sp. WS9]
MKLSIVATLYQSENWVAEFCARAGAAAGQFAGDDYEIVLVNDGSPDRSLDVAVQMAAADPHLVVVDLSRNFGHHKAMMTGLAAARGDKVFLVDSDLEEQPEWLSLFAQNMDRDCADVVFGVQGPRKGRAFERLSGRMFYKVFRLLTGIAQPDNIVTARLMSRRYVDALLLHREREVNIGGLWIITGFKQTQLPVQKLSVSPTTYSLSRKISHLVNAVTSFSSVPLAMTFYAGLLISLSAMLFIFFLVGRYFSASAPPDGYTSIVASIWLFSGLIIFFMGVQGIYIAKIFSEVKQRPYTVVRRVYRGGASAGDAL